MRVKSHSQCSLEALARSAAPNGQCSPLPELEGAGSGDLGEAELGRKGHRLKAKSHSRLLVRSAPLPFPSPSRSVSIILEPRQLPSSPETQSNFGVGPAPGRAEVEMTSDTPPPPPLPAGSVGERGAEAGLEPGKAGRKSLRLAALVTACPAPLRHRREPARSSSPRGGAGDRGPGRRPLR